MGLSLPFPLVEIPMGEQSTQIIALVNIKLAEYGRDAVLDGIRGNVQTKHGLYFLLCNLCFVCDG